MNKSIKLDHLASIADETLAGLQTDEAMRLRIVRAARGTSRPGKKNIKRFAPALTFAAAALVCIGVASTQLEPIAPDVSPAAIDEIAAGEPMVMSTRMVADLGDGASIRMGKSSGGSLMSEGAGEHPIVTVNGAVYRMLETPQDMGSSLIGKKIATISAYTEQPSLASADEMKAGISNVAGKDSAVYAVSGVAQSSAVAAEVGGSMRLFQRVSYAGKGPGGASLEDTFAVRNKVKTAELSGVGTLEGKKANEVIAVLLDHATLQSADAGSARQYLTVTLDSGLKLQLGVSGDTVCGCGGWSCPEFFEAFEAAL